MNKTCSLLISTCLLFCLFSNLDFLLFCLFPNLDFGKGIIRLYLLKFLVCVITTTPMQMYRMF